VTPSSSPLRALTANRLLRREAAALALYRLAEFGPWVAMLVFAYGQGGATTTGLVSLALLVPTALFAPFVTGAIVPASVLLRLRPLRRVDAAVAVPVVAIALLGSLQVFRALPVPALEGVAQAAHNLCSSRDGDRPPG
jgi:hypothetical protein